MKKIAILAAAALAACSGPGKADRPKPEAPVSVSMIPQEAAAPKAGAAYRLVIPKLPKAPKIDGTLDDEAWVAASAKHGKVVVDLDENASGIAQRPRIAYAGYDKDGLYVAFVIQSKDKLSANEKDGGEIWNDDEGEIFLQPKKGGPYGQLCVNAGGAKYAEVKDGEVAGWKLDLARAAGGRTGITTVIEVAIPFPGGAAPAPGTAWRMNFAGHECEAGVWLTCSPTSGSFHDPEAFMDAVFE
jgi:hypothetical protein